MTSFSPGSRRNDQTCPGAARPGRTGAHNRGDEIAHIQPRCCVAGWVVGAAETRWRRDGLLRAPAYPVGPVGPPGARMLLRLGQPHLGVRHRLADRRIGGLRVAGRVDQARRCDRRCSARTCSPGEQLGGAVAAGPRRQVVGRRAGHERVGTVIAPRSTGVPSTVIAPGVAQRVVLEEVEELAVQPGRQVGASAFQARMSKTGGSLPSR